ncbi:MAG: hypothetical protein ACTHPD_10615 [Rhizomicrobium sp.]
MLAQQRNKVGPVYQTVADVSARPAIDYSCPVEQSPGHILMTSDFDRQLAESRAKQARDASELEERIETGRAIAERIAEIMRRSLSTHRGRYSFEVFTYRDSEDPVHCYSVRARTLDGSTGIYAIRFWDSHCRYSAGIKDAQYYIHGPLSVSSDDIQKLAAYGLKQMADQIARYEHDEALKPPPVTYAKQHASSGCAIPIAAMTLTPTFLALATRYLG